MTIFTSSMDATLEEAIVSLLNHITLAIDLWDSSAQYQMKHAIHPSFGSSAFLHIHHAASHGFFPLKC